MTCGAIGPPPGRRKSSSFVEVTAMRPGKWVKVRLIEGAGVMVGILDMIKETGITIHFPATDRYAFVPWHGMIYVEECHQGEERSY